MYQKKLMISFKLGTIVAIHYHHQSCNGTIAKKLIKTIQVKLMLHSITANIEQTKSLDRTVQFHGKHGQKYVHR